MCRTKDIMRKIELEKKVNKNKVLKLTRTSKDNDSNKFIQQSFYFHSKNNEQKLIALKSKYSDYLKTSCQQTFFLTSTNEKELLKTI